MDEEIKRKKSEKTKKVRTGGRENRINMMKVDGKDVMKVEGKEEGWRRKRKFNERRGYKTFENKITRDVTYSCLF